jgi:hypothetical protein
MVCWQVANVSGVIEVFLLVGLLVFLSSVAKHSVRINRLSVIHFFAILLVHVGAEEVVVHLLVGVNSILVFVIIGLLLHLSTHVLFTHTIVNLLSLFGSIHLLLFR